MISKKERKAEELYKEGMRCLLAGQFADAVMLLDISTRLFAESADAFAALCLAAHEEGRHDLLHNSLMKLLDLPDRAAIQRGVAVSYYDGGFYEEAIISVLESISLSPHHSLSNYILGRSYLALQMFGEAERVFQQALKLEPDFTVVQFLLSWLRSYLSSPESEREPLLTNAPRVPMHKYPPEIGELKRYPFAPDSIKDLYGDSPTDNGNL